MTAEVPLTLPDRVRTWAEAMARTMKSPRPTLRTALSGVPPRTIGSNIVAIRAGGMTGPVL